MSSNKRPASDVMKLMMKDFKVEMINDQMRDFHVEFHGPNESLYQGGVWRIKVTLPDNYPFQRPVINFVDKIYHPNINEKYGTICLNSIMHSWSPMFDLVNVFEIFIPQLLLYPNPSHPMNQEAAALMLSDQSSYEAKVKEYCQQYAKPVETAPSEDVSSDEELTEDENDSSDDEVADTSIGNN